METLLGAICLRRESSLVRRQRRSVGLEMQHLDIDAVPAIETDQDGFILIPDKDAGEWILTAPRVHAERAMEVNQARGNRFKPLVNVLKSWNARLPKKAAFKSSSIEAMALHLFATTPFQSMFEGALKFFDFLSGQFVEDTHFDWRGEAGIGLARPCWEYKLFDVAGTGSNLFANAKAFVPRDLLWRANGARSAERCRDFLESALLQEPPQLLGIEQAASATGARPYGVTNTPEFPTPQRRRQWWPLGSGQEGGRWGENVACGLSQNCGGGPSASTYTHT
ncbi:hypothetical protein HV826_15560 [Myxococcus sp. AM010]|nr:hypothetical protein [Myxococcus sp. AM010]